MPAGFCVASVGISYVSQGSSSSGVIESTSGAGAWKALAQRCRMSEDDAMCGKAKATCDGLAKQYGAQYEAQLTCACAAPRPQQFVVGLRVFRDQGQKLLLCCGAVWVHKGPLSLEQDGHASLDLVSKRTGFECVQDTSASVSESFEILHRLVRKWFTYLGESRCWCSYHTSAMWMSQAWGGVGSSTAQRLPQSSRAEIVQDKDVALSNEQTGLFNACMNPDIMRSVAAAVYKRTQFGSGFTE
jgi:hypothetical protein